MAQPNGGAPQDDKPNDQGNKSPTAPAHPEYCIPGGDLFLLVEGVQFRVHSYFFLRESKRWQAKLSGSVSPGDTRIAKGKDASNPVELENEKSEDFALFLSVFYNPHYGDYSKVTLENWITILNYCTKWQFPHMKELAIRHIEKFDMDPIQRIRLYKDNNVPETHLLSLYVKLASRDQFLTLEEAHVLGVDTLFLVHQARERLRVPPPGASKNPVSPVRSEYKEPDIKRIVASTFNIPV